MRPSTWPTASSSPHLDPLRFDDVEIVRGSDLIIVTAGAKQLGPGSPPRALADDRQPHEAFEPAERGTRCPNMFVTNPDVVTYVA